jgi:hypothetical protein
MWDDAIAAFVGAVAGFVLSRSAGKAVESLLSKLGLTMTSVYQNNQPWQGLCTHDSGGTYGYAV